MPVQSPLKIVAVTADAASAASAFAGYNFANSTGAAITVSIHDDLSSTAGPLLVRVVVPANGSVDVMYPIPIPLSSASIWVDWTTGISGSVRLIA